MREEREIFICDYCKKEYASEKAMFDCFRSHDIVYVGLPRDKLKGLLYSLEAAYLQGIQIDEQTYKILSSYKRYKGK